MLVQQTANTYRKQRPSSSQGRLIHPFERVVFTLETAKRRKQPSGWKSGIRLTTGLTNFRETGVSFGTLTG